MNGPVLVVQPVHQHGYETALAAQEAGLLRYFVTGLYDTGRGLARAARRVPGAQRELARRRHPLLDPANVLTIGRYHLPATALRRLAGRALLDTWAHDRFDEELARRLPRIGGLRTVHGFEGVSRATFRAARRLGATTVLDVTSAAELYERVQAETSHLARIREERALADVLLAPSPLVVETLVEHGVPRERVELVPYGVDLERFEPARRRDDGVFRVLCVGAVCARKGTRHLVEAWRRLALPDAELVLVGPATDEPGRALLRDLPAGVRFAGETPKRFVGEWFARSDAFCLPSLAESWGLAVGEAMASALPVVTTTGVGAPVRDGVDGLVVPPADADALAAALARLHGDPALRRRLGAAGRELVAREYTWERYRERVAELHRSLLGVREPAHA